MSITEALKEVKKKFRISQRNVMMKVNLDLEENDEKLFTSRTESDKNVPAFITYQLSHKNLKFSSSGFYVRWAIVMSQEIKLPCERNCLLTCVGIVFTLI